MRLNQLCIAAYSIEGDLLPQSKAVTITENGITEITPDEGYLLTGVTVDTAVPGKPEQTKAVTIRQNGITEVTPDAGHVLTGVTVDTAVPGKPEQVKAVTITENGTTQITPDEGKVLSGVSVSVDVAGGASVVTIPPVSLPLKSTTENILARVTDIDLGAIEWAASSIYNISSLFRGMTDLKNIKWGDLPNRISGSLVASNLFQDCKQIETIDLAPVLINTSFIRSADGMFYGCTSLKNVSWGNGNKKIKSSSLSNLFSNCSSLASIDTSFLDSGYSGTTNIGGMFYKCSLIETLDLSNLKTAKITNVYSVFSDCNSLTNIVFEDGCFSNNSVRDLSFSSCPLSHDCAVDIFNKLATRTNSPTLKLSATTKGYLTENEIAIATGKGWVVS